MMQFDIWGGALPPTPIVDNDEKELLSVLTTGPNTRQLPLIGGFMSIALEQFDDQEETY